MLYISAMVKKVAGLLFLFLNLFIVSWSQSSSPTFTNPILPSGADPWNICINGYYYYTNSLGDSIVIWKTKTLAELHSAERRTIYIPPPNTLYSKELWAPEIHFINKKW